MSVPQHLWRFPTPAAEQSMAKRFALPWKPTDQFWELYSGDPRCIDDFLAAYVSGQLDDDERFVLMELLIGAFERHADAADGAMDLRWPQLLALLDQHVELHAHSLWYWANPDNPADESDLFFVTPSLRPLLAKHRERLEAKAPA